MLAGYQYMSAGGSVRAVESAKGSLYNALIGFAVRILCKIIAGLVGGALSAPGGGGGGGHHRGSNGLDPGAAELAAAAGGSCAMPRVVARRVLLDRRGQRLDQKVCICSIAISGVMA